MKINYIDAPKSFIHKSTFEGKPADQGFYFPAEWAPHEATWLSWPHNTETWPGKINAIYPPYCQFIKLVSEGEKVNINVVNRAMADSAGKMIEATGVDMNQIFFYENPTNDAWCRDHGPAYLLHPSNRQKIIVDWDYNAWGGKYPPFDLDDVIPTRIAAQYGIAVVHPGIIMEGGSVDFNGAGTVLTTSSCLLNPNRNPQFTQDEIEQHLRDFYGVKNILWLGDGIVGDDTDGHIDDITRFVNENTVVTVLEENPEDENYTLLRDNMERLKTFTINGDPLSIVELPMPAPVFYKEQRLPASYANFYIANNCVIVPVFGDVNDDKALEILQACFPKRKVVGINSIDIIWGLGSFHCLSQQEPK